MDLHRRSGAATVATGDGVRVDPRLLETEGIAEGLYLGAMIVASIETRRRITTNLIRYSMIYIVGADCGGSCPEDTATA